MMEVDRKSHVALVLVAIAIASSSAIAQSKITADGGTKEFHHFLSTFSREQLKADIRDFVWTRWNSRSKGKIRASHAHIDCGPDITEFRIDKDRQNRWFVEVRAFHKSDRFWHGDDQLELKRYFDVSRVEVISYEGASEIPTPIRTGSKRDATSFRVRLRSESASDDFVF